MSFGGHRGHAFVDAKKVRRKALCSTKKACLFLRCCCLSPLDHRPSQVLEDKQGYVAKVRDLPSQPKR